MKKLFIVTALLVICTYGVSGFGICTLVSVITWLMVVARKIGYFCKKNTVAAIEIAGMFMYIVGCLMFQKIRVLQWIAILICRLIFIAIVFYEDKHYVYVKEEKRRMKDE